MYTHIFTPQCDKAYLDYGTVIVGTTCTKTIVLMNNSDCSLHYKLLVDQRIEGPYPEEHTRYDPIGECSNYYSLSPNFAVM